MQDQSALAQWAGNSLGISDDQVNILFSICSTRKENFSMKNSKNNSFIVLKLNIFNQTVFVTEHILWWQYHNESPSHLENYQMQLSVRPVKGGEGGEMIGLRRDNDHSGRYDDRPAVPWLIWEMVSEQLY